MSYSKILPVKKGGGLTKEEKIKKERAKKREETKAVKETIDNLPNLYKCTCCGKVVVNPQKVFYLIEANPVLEGNGRRTNICIECLDKLLKQLTITYSSQKIATMLVCMYMGIYFSEQIYEKVAEKERENPKDEFTIGKYLRSLINNGFRNYSFLTYIIELLRNTRGNTSLKDFREGKEDGWSIIDKRNKSMCIKEIGYDCFDDKMYSSGDRKLMFNSLAQYLNNGDIAEDKHRKDAAISIVKTNMQIEFLDRELTKESRSVNPNFQRVDKLIAAKRNLSAIINTVAKENAISTSGGGKKGGSSLALTAIMKELVDSGAMEAKTNLTDVKMENAFQMIANISAKALMGELNITGDEYAEMVGKQADTIRGLNKKVDELEEKLRLANIEIHDLRSSGKRSICHTVEFDENGLAIIDAETFKNVEEEYRDDAPEIPEFIKEMDVELTQKPFRVLQEEEAEMPGEDEMNDNDDNSLG